MVNTQRNTHAGYRLRPTSSAKKGYADQLTEYFLGRRAEQDPSSVPPWDKLHRHFLRLSAAKLEQLWWEVRR